MSNSRKVLIPTYYFPPYGTVGVLRIARFIQSLPESGWEPYVLTVTDEHHKDSKTVHELSETRNVAEQIKKTTVPFYGSIHQFTGFIGTTSSIRSRLVTTAWVPRLIQAATRTIRAQDIDVVLMTANPFFPLIALPIIKQRTGVPYVIDLRDPWSLSGSSVSNKGIASKIREIIDEKAEKPVIRNASKVITVTDSLAEKYQSQYPKYADKFSVVHNGYDPNEYENVTPDPSQKFRITLPGSWYGIEHSQSFLEGFTDFVAKHNSELVHLGHTEPDIEEAIQEYEIDENIDLRGYVARDTVAATVKGSDVGLAINRNSNGLPMKIFDFVACNIPILAICESNSTLDQFVSQFEHGYTAEKNNPDEIESVLTELWNVQPTQLGAKEQINKYKIGTLCGKLATILDSAGA